MDIDLYSVDPGEYDSLQYLRDDYRLALEASLRAAKRHARGRLASVVDFCGGTGVHLQEIDDWIGIGRGLVIDINPEFLKLAEKRELRFCRLETCCEDISKATVPNGFDLVLATFAYHHVPDNEKFAFLLKAREAMKDSGRLVLTEIYLPDREVTLQYYRKVLEEIPGGIENSKLCAFLTQTAESTEFEYKVAKEFAEAQFKEVGFRVLEEEMVWPPDRAFGDNVGTFVTVLCKT